MMNDDELPPGWLRRDAATAALAPDRVAAPDALPIPATVYHDEPAAWEDDPAPLGRTYPAVPEEPADRRDEWDPFRLAVMADGKAWALPEVDDAMLDRVPGLGGAIRFLVALKVYNGRFLAGSLPEPSAESLDLLVGWLVAMRTHVAMLGFALIQQNYALADSEAMALLPGRDSATFAGFQEAVFGACFAYFPADEDVTADELGRAEALFTH